MDPFFLEQRLQEGSPDLHKRLNDSIFVLRTMLQKFLIRFPDFTDHSILHSMDVAEFCNSIIGYDQVQKLLPEECYVLLMACNAGHMNPALQRAGGEYRLLEYEHDVFVGPLPKAQYHAREFDLNPGDTLFVYTDGVTEAFNPDNEEYGEERLIESLNRNTGAAPEDLAHSVYNDVQAFADGAQQSDDITMLCLRYNGPAEN